MIRTWGLCALSAVALVGSGGGQSASSLRFGHGDSATFVVAGRTISLTQSGTTSARIQGAPEMTYDGPVGCAGRYFTADFADGVPMFFRYGSQDAYLLIGSDLYYFGGAPERSGGGLGWDTYSSGHQIHIELGCAPPPHTGPLTGSK